MNRLQAARISKLGVSDDEQTHDDRSPSQDVALRLAYRFLASAGMKTARVQELRVKFFKEGDFFWKVSAALGKLAMGLRVQRLRENKLVDRLRRE